MSILVSIILIITSVVMVLLILLHRGKGGGLSDLFGGGVSSTLSGSSVVERLAVVASITEEAAAYAEEVARECAAAGLRVVADTGNEKIIYKVREHSLGKVPIILVVGRREAEQRSVALRRLGGSAQESLALGEAVARLKEEAEPPGRASRLREDEDGSVQLLEGERTYPGHP